MVLERKESWERERATVSLITTGGAGDGVGVEQAVGVGLALRAPMDAVGVGVWEGVPVSLPVWEAVREKREDRECERVASALTVEHRLAL